MKKKNLEIKLEQVPPHPDPDVKYEQYSTPAVIAADILFTAYTQGDIQSKKIIDLGCGTGIFSLGAGLLGAEEVVGMDIDEESIRAAKDLSSQWGLSDTVHFETTEVNDVDENADTVIMNPPFGSQKKHADVPFLDKAMEIADKIYSLHNLVTRDFVLKHVQQNDYKVVGEKRYMFELDNIFIFHTQRKKPIEVGLFIIERK
ncbi:MAG: METTL5 family protein [Thermoplasmata archaeon]